MDKVKTLEDFKKIPFQLNLGFAPATEKGIEFLKYVLHIAMERKDLICDFNDSKHPLNKIGRCEEPEFHYERATEEIELTEKEQIVFDNINDKFGWDEACKHFDDKFNPDDQELTLTLGYDEENAKFIDTESYYVCKKCLNEINENSDGSVCCDMDNFE